MLRFPRCNGFRLINHAGIIVAVVIKGGNAHIQGVFNQVGDFGYGWSLELAGPRLEVSPSYDVTITEPGTGRRVHV